MYYVMKSLFPVNENYVNFKVRSGKIIVFAIFATSCISKCRNICPSQQQNMNVACQLLSDTLVRKFKSLETQYRKSNNFERKNA